MPFIIKICYGPLYTLGIGMGLISSLFSKKMRRFFLERIGLSKRICQYAPKEALWFHVASSGEFEQCLAICDGFRKKQPHQKIFISYFSPTARDAIAVECNRRQTTGLVPSWDYADYSPLDFRWSVRKYIGILQPKKLMIIHREFWIRMLSECRTRKIPTRLCAVGFSHPSSWVKPWFKFALSYFDEIATTDVQSQENINQVYRGKLLSLGDPRIDRIVSRRDKKTPVWKTFFEDQTIFIAASIWPKEFNVLKESFLLALSNQWRLILVPHEKDEPFIRKIIGWFKGIGFPIRRWSHWMQEPDDTSHLVVDSVGSLAEMYQISSLVFIGGSLFSKVHNVLEPALFGNAILAGPRIRNSVDAVTLSQAKGLLSASDTSHFHLEAADLIRSPERRRELGIKAKHYLESRVGAADKYVEWIS